MAQISTLWPTSFPGMLTEPISDLLLEMANSTHVALFILGSFNDGLPLLWANRAFTAKTGLTPSRAAKLPIIDTNTGGPNLGVMARMMVDPQAAQVAVPAVASGEGGTFTFECLDKNSSPYWADVTLTPKRDASGRTSHFLGQAVDVTNYIEEQSLTQADLQAERRRGSDLDLIAQTSELLANLESPHALADIADMLRKVVPWAGFYLNDEGLVFAEGLDPTAPPGSKGRRHSRYQVGGDEDLTVKADEAIRGVAVTDSVQDLIDGIIDGPVVLPLDLEYPPYSASGWLRRELVRRVTRDTGVVPGSVTVHAMAGRRQVLGALVTWDGYTVGEEPGNEADAARRVIEVVARRAGTAIDNARLYAREHRLAEALQRAMLPEQADVSGLDVWTYYAPNAEHAQVGGDWYDVVEIDPLTVALVIGDVVGHDVEAAAAMGQLRSVVRAFSMEPIAPGAVLDRVDQLFRAMRIPRSASLVFATLRRVPPQVNDAVAEFNAHDETTKDKWRLEYTRAGHLPPLVFRDGQVLQLNDGAGSLVGFGQSGRPTATEILVPGDVLVLYTDGLIERRDRPMKQGLDQLVAEGAEITARDAAGVGEELLSRLVKLPEDDVAIVVVRVPDPTTDIERTDDSPRSRRWTLPSEPSSIGRARHAVAKSCAAWGIAESASAELVVSELVANGVLHGWGSLELRLYDTGEGLRIEVEDSNPAPPVTLDGHPNRVGGFGMQIVERLAEWGWRPAGAGKLVWARLRPQPKS